MDDFNGWLKASTENKITTKNTWKSTLIDHFTDISKFEEQRGINFQKAGSVLDGCVKVYSTRVDDVVENTQRLLSILDKEETVKKKVTKKKASFIEKNLSNINLKERISERYYDGVFSTILNKRDGDFLLALIQPSKSGMEMHGRPRPEITLEDEKVEHQCLAAPISPSLLEIKAVQPEPFVFDRERREEIAESYRNFEEDCEIEVDDERLPEEPVYVAEETPFGYFRGWSGPGEWKVSLNATAPRRPPRTKEPFFLDFSGSSDCSLLFGRGDTPSHGRRFSSADQSAMFFPRIFPTSVRCSTGLSTSPAPFLEHPDLFPQYTMENQGKTKN